MHNVHRIRNAAQPGAKSNNGTTYFSYEPKIQEWENQTNDIIANRNKKMENMFTFLS